MIEEKRDKNLCSCRQNVYIAASDNIVTACRIRHADLPSIAWRFMKYIIGNVLRFSGYLVLI
jgi:hypothetical protein